MGESIKKEFSLGSGVDTGRVQPVPPQQQNVGGVQLSMPQPGIPVMRKSFLQSFLANLGPALAGGLAAGNDPRFPFGTGLPGALGGIQQAKQIQVSQQVEQQKLGMERSEERRVGKECRCRGRLNE